MQLGRAAGTDKLGEAEGRGREAGESGSTEKGTEERTKTHNEKKEQQRKVRERVRSWPVCGQKRESPQSEQ